MKCVVFGLLGCLAFGTESKPLPRENIVGRFSNDAVSHEALETAIKNGLDRVEEITFLRNEMKKLGLKRGWLFGGTAAAFGHYANWDVRRQQGDKKFQPERFDYDYANIFRSTQDLDIVIDGTPEQAEALENRLREIYPHLQGTQSAWEVRLLKKARGSKEALLGNANFLNQHTDSNSTGLIEFTPPPSGEPVVTDLRDPGKRYPKFFEDLRLGKLKFYFSPKHHTTARFKKGLNPPIFSVVRYFTKALQYELEVDPEDEAKLRQIIRDTKPGSIKEEQAVAWIRKNGKKLLQNAVNMEYAAALLDQYGLRKFLSEFDSPNQVDSLAWWMNRKPLASFPLGKRKQNGRGKGKTAQELGIAGVVSHETSDYLAYESITRSHTGEPNVFVSREKASGEVAAFGEGFYTRVGREGGRGTGITIRFELSPDAVDGKDFTYLNKEYVLVHNKKALNVIPEALDLTPRQYFEVLIASAASWGENDKSILEKFKRRMAKKLTAKPEELAEIAKIVNPALLGEEPKGALLQEWISVLENQLGKNPKLEDFLRPLTQSKNAWVQWKANYLLSEAGFPSALPAEKNLQTYFQAIRTLAPDTEPSDPHFKKLKAQVNMKSVTPEDFREIYQSFLPALQKPAGMVQEGPNFYYGQQEWQRLWHAANEAFPRELQTISLELVKGEEFRHWPRQLGMNTLGKLLELDPLPSLVDFHLTLLERDSFSLTPKAIDNLAKLNPQDPRVPASLARFFDHQESYFRNPALQSFATIKTNDESIRRSLLKAFLTPGSSSANAYGGIMNNLPTDKKSEALLVERIREGAEIDPRALHVLYEMPGRTPARLGVIAEALHKDGPLAMQAAKELLGEEAYRAAAHEALWRVVESKEIVHTRIEAAKILAGEGVYLTELESALKAIRKEDRLNTWHVPPLLDEIAKKKKALRKAPRNCGGAFAELGRK